jgi:hypothetical protein
MIDEDTYAIITDRTADSMMDLLRRALELWISKYHDDLTMGEPTRRKRGGGGKGGNGGKGGERLEKGGESGEKGGKGGKRGERLKKGGKGEKRVLPV